MKKIISTTLLFSTLLSASFSGILIDSKTQDPLVNAKISDSNHTVTSDENGSFNIQSDERTLHIKAYGYRRFQINEDTNESTLKLDSIDVKALYLTFWGAGIKSKTLKRTLNVVDKSEVNAIIVDVKTEYGETSYKTSFKQINSYGAWYKRSIKDIDEFMALMKEKNIYTIARIVTFKDQLQAKNNPSYAIKRQSGKAWTNHDKMGWVDPFDKRSHNYTISVAEDAAQVGFDEVNFDYIRFPAKKGLKYSKKSTQKNRVAAISQFLKTAQDRLRKYGVFISVDTYGNICWANDDTGIGQTVEGLAEYADYLAPMLYPSGFNHGQLGYKNPAEHPYGVLFKSLNNIKDRIDPKRVRPWLQYFKDYAHTRKHYRRPEIQAQIKASKDTNTSGWMMWSPSSKYHLSYFN